MTSLKLVALSASTHRPSRTRDFVETLARRASESLGASLKFFELCEIRPGLMAVPFRVALEGRAKEALDSVEQADALIIGLPAKKLSCVPALLLHLIELADREQLAGKPVVFFATGAQERDTRATRLHFRLLARHLGARVALVAHVDRSQLRATAGDASMPNLVGRATERLRPLFNRPSLPRDR